MGKKSEHIVSYTEAELKAMRSRGETKSDWAKAATVPLPEGSDPDDAMGETDWVTTELPMPRRKTHASLRLDADMLDWFKAQGRGYQTKINAILRSYFQQHMR
jgi:uncharacterized protein (DUF4415 family)